MNLYFKSTKSFLKCLGIDQSIFWSVTNKAFGIFRAPVTLYFLVQFLTLEEQGLWYTFLSLAALSMLADLGFTSIITQFVSHEFANLKFNKGYIEGPLDKVDRLMALIEFSFKFYLKIIIISFFLLTVVGFLYFKTSEYSIHGAWMLFSLIGAFSLFISLFQAIFQGLDKMKEIQINILFNSLFVTFFTCFALYFQLKIWSLIIGSVFGTILTAFGLFRIGKQFWIQIFHYKIRGEYQFFKETFPLQIKYAASFIASYFISYLYIPATFKYVGHIEAGQLGLTLSIITVINSISNSWLFTRVPKFNIFVSRGKYNELDQIFKKSIFQGFFIQILLSVLFVISISIINCYFPAFSNRLLKIHFVILLLFPQVAIFLISGLTLYLRAFKKEPLVWLQIINAILLILAIFFILTKGMGIEYFLYSINFIYWIIIFPLVIFKFIEERKLLIV